MDNYSLSLIDSNSYSLKVIDDKELSITLFGPAGPEGNEGATGATGTTGATGLRGATGVTVTTGGPAQSIQFKVGTNLSGNENFTYDQGINLVQLINGGRLLVEGGTFPAIEVASASGHGVQSTTSFGSPFVGYSEYDGCTFSSNYGIAAEIYSNFNHALYTHSYDGTTQLVSEYNYGAVIQSFSSAGAYIESIQTTGAVIVGGAFSDLNNFPAAHCRFGGTANTSLSIKSSDGSLYWRLGTDGTQTCTLARPSAITGQRIATLPNSSGLVGVANTRTSTDNASSVSDSFATVISGGVGLIYPSQDLLANGIYKLEFSGKVTHNATGLYKLQALMTSKDYAIGSYINTLGVSVPVTSGTTTTHVLGAVASGSATNQPIYAMAIIKVGAANSTLDIQFAQSVPNATASTLAVGATVTLTRIS